MNFQCYTLFLQFPGEPEHAYDADVLGMGQHSLISVDGWSFTSSSLKLPRRKETLASPACVSKLKLAFIPDFHKSTNFLIKELNSALVTIVIYLILIRAVIFFYVMTN